MLVSEYGLPNDVELRIQSVVYTELQELDADLVVENMFSIFSFNSMARNRLVLDELLNEIRCSLFLEKLKKVRNSLYTYLSFFLLKRDEGRAPKFPV